MRERANSDVLALSRIDAADQGEPECGVRCQCTTGLRLIIEGRNLHAIRERDDVCATSDGEIGCKLIADHDCGLREVALQRKYSRRELRSGYVTGMDDHWNASKPAGDRGRE